MNTAFIARSTLWARSRSERARLPLEGVPMNPEIEPLALTSRSRRLAAWPTLDPSAGILAHAPASRPPEGIDPDGCVPVPEGEPGAEEPPADLVVPLLGRWRSLAIVVLVVDVVSDVVVALVVVVLFDLLEPPQALSSSATTTIAK